jgi:hypothetical protein
MQESIEVAGAAVLRRTSSALKSVCVSSVLAGPRSRDLGGGEALESGRVVCIHRRGVKEDVWDGVCGFRGANVGRKVDGRLCRVVLRAQCALINFRRGLEQLILRSIVTRDVQCAECWSYAMDEESRNRSRAVIEKELGPL